MDALRGDAMRIQTIPLVLAAVTFVAASASAAALDLSLREAVRRALAEGTAARIASDQVERSSADAIVARSALLPTLESSVSGGEQVINLKTFGFSPPQGSTLAGPFSSVDGRITAATKLVDVAAIRRYEASRHGVRVSQSEQRGTENDVAAAVATLYLAIQRAQAKVDQARANVALFEKLRALALDREKAGVSFRLGTMRADVQLARERQAEIVARNDVDAARLALLHAVGADLDTEVRLTDPLVEAESGFAGAAEAMTAAHAARPELAAAAERLREAQLRVGAAEAERWPVIGATAYAAQNGNGLNDLDTTYQAQGLLTLPIFTGGRVEGDIAAARAERHVRELETIELERRIGEEVRRALLTHQSAKSRIVLANENARLAAAELELTRDRFANGLSTSIEVDNAQTSLSSAETTRIDALADEAQAAVDVARATGRIRDLVPGGKP
jgi:outer membrane protein TolC